MQDLIIANERLKAQANEKDRLISLYTKSDYSDQSQSGMPISELPQGILESRLARETQKETELLHSRLRDIAQAVINDDQVFSCTEEKVASLTSLSPRSGRSPVRRVNNSSRPASRGGSPFADATFSAVQAALSKRQLQVH